MNTVLTPIPSPRGTAPTTNLSKKTNTPVIEPPKDSSNEEVSAYSSRNSQILQRVTQGNLQANRVLGDKLHVLSDPSEMNLVNIIEKTKIKNLFSIFSDIKNEVLKINNTPDAKNFILPPSLFKIATDGNIIVELSDISKDTDTITKKVIINDPELKIKIQDFMTNYEHYLVPIRFFANNLLKNLNGTFSLNQNAINTIFSSGNFIEKPHLLNFSISHQNEVPPDINYDIWATSIRLGPKGIAGGNKIYKFLIQDPVGGTENTALVNKLRTVRDILKRLNFILDGAFLMYSIGRFATANKPSEKIKHLGGGISGAWGLISAAAGTYAKSTWAAGIGGSYAAKIVSTAGIISTAGIPVGIAIGAATYLSVHLFQNQENTEDIVNKLSDLYTDYRDIVGITNHESLGSFNYQSISFNRAKEIDFSTNRIKYPEDGIRFFYESDWKEFQHGGNKEVIENTYYAYPKEMPEDELFSMSQAFGHEAERAISENGNIPATRILPSDTSRTDIRINIWKNDNALRTHLNNEAKESVIQKLIDNGISGPIPRTAKDNGIYPQTINSVFTVRNEIRIPDSLKIQMDAGINQNYIIPVDAAVYHPSYEFTTHSEGGVSRISGIIPQCNISFEDSKDQLVPSLLEFAFSGAKIDKKEDFSIHQEGLKTYLHVQHDDGRISKIDISNIKTSMFHLIGTQYTWKICLKTNSKTIIEANFKGIDKAQAKAQLDNMCNQGLLAPSPSPVRIHFAHLPSATLPTRPIAPIRPVLNVPPPTFDPITNTLISPPSEHEALAKYDNELKQYHQDLLKYEASLKAYKEDLTAYNKTSVEQHQNTLTTIYDTQTKTIIGYDAIYNTIEMGSKLISTDKKGNAFFAKLDSGNLYYFDSSTNKAHKYDLLLPHQAGFIQNFDKKGNTIYFEYVIPGKDGKSVVSTYRFKQGQSPKLIKISGLDGNLLRTAALPTEEEIRNTIRRIRETRYRMADTGEQGKVRNINGPRGYKYQVRIIVKNGRVTDAKILSVTPEPLAVLAKSLLGTSAYPTLPKSIRYADRIMIEGMDSNGNLKTHYITKS